MSVLGNYSEGQKNFGLLILRIGIGVMFIMHGYHKIIGGPDKWEKLGHAMGELGITFVPVFWGFMAALAEFGGGILLIIGLMFRPACLLLLFTMVVATLMHMGKGDSIVDASHSIEMGILFLSLLFIGPGRYRVGKVVLD